MYEPLIELAATAFFGVGAVVLSAVGVYLEQFGFGLVSAGQPKLGAWVCLMGLMAFYFGLYAMGYHEVRPRLRELLARRSA
jgi:hypothetical protein